MTVIVRVTIQVQYSGWDRAYIQLLCGTIRSANSPQKGATVGSWQPTLLATWVEEDGSGTRELDGALAASTAPSDVSSVF